MIENATSPHFEFPFSVPSSLMYLGYSVPCNGYNIKSRTTTTVTITRHCPIDHLHLSIVLVMMVSYDITMHQEAPPNARPPVPHVSLAAPPSVAAAKKNTKLKSNKQQKGPPPKGHLSEMVTRR